MRGIVKEYDRKKQFGFIRCIGSESHGRKVIVNRKDLANTEYLIKGDLIDFVLSRDGHARDIFLIRKVG